jgi:hypothetical protein
MMECYQLANQLNPSLKQQNQSKTDKGDSKKLTEKSKDKKRKAKPKKNVMPDSWTRQFSHDGQMSNHARTSLLNERSLEKHFSGRMLSSET